MSTERNYPIPAPDDDPRFTVGLMLEVRDVIEAHGFPKMTGYDVVELQQALFRLIYSTNDPAV